MQSSAKHPLEDITPLLKNITSTTVCPTVLRYRKTSASTTGTQDLDVKRKEPRQTPNLTQTQISNFELTPRRTSLAVPNLPQRKAIVCPYTSLISSNTSSAKMHFISTFSPSFEPSRLLPLPSSFFISLPERFRTGFLPHSEHGHDSAPVTAAADNSSWCKFCNP